jgi:hypothetical protein
MSFSLNTRLGSGYDFTSSAGGVVGTPLTVSVTPVQTQQASPGGQLLTATAAGGTAPYTYSWSAKFVDGTNADSYLSNLTGSTTTLTSTAYSQSFLITCVATDASAPSALSNRDDAIVSVVAPSNLTAQISPESASQTNPGGQLFTVTPSGGVTAYSYAWSATFTDGTDANAYLSALVGAAVTLTSTNYRQSFRIACVVSDNSPNPQIANLAAVLSVGEPPALVAPTDLTPTQLANGTTSTPFTFGDASAGAPPYTYAMIVQSSTGGVTLSTYTGQSATIQGLTDSATAQVTIQATDSLGQTADATYVVGVGVVPVFNENALWNYIGGTDLRTIGSGSRSGAGTLTVGGITFTVAPIVGAPTGQALNVSASGVRLSQTSGVATATGVRFDSGLLANFTTGESILVNFLFSATSFPFDANTIVSFGDSVDYSLGDAYALQVNGNLNLVARRTTANIATTYNMGTQAAAANKTYAAQVLLVAGRIPYCTISESSVFLGGPRLGLPQPMRGTYVGCPGAQTTGSGATFTSPLSSLLIQLAIASGNFGVTLLAYEVRRLTRAS